MEYDGTFCWFLNMGTSKSSNSVAMFGKEVHGFEGPQCVFETAIKLSLKLRVCTLLGNFTKLCCKGPVLKTVAHQNKWDKISIAN
jgi:hypothetical protein